MVSAESDMRSKRARRSLAEVAEIVMSLGANTWPMVVKIYIGSQQLVGEARLK